MITVTINADVDVDVSDVFDQLDDENLIEEIERRHLNLATNQLPESYLEIVRDAYEELLRGRAAEAQVVLERLLFPKWANTKACKDQYARAPRKLEASK